MWVGGVLNARGPHPHYDHLGPLNYGATSPRCHYGILLVHMVLRAFLIERCAIIVVFMMSILLWIRMKLGHEKLKSTLNLERSSHDPSRVSFPIQVLFMSLNTVQKKKAHYLRARFHVPVPVRFLENKWVDGSKRGGAICPFPSPKDRYAITLYVV